MKRLGERQKESARVKRLFAKRTCVGNEQLRCNFCGHSDESDEVEWHRESQSYLCLDCRLEYEKPAQSFAGLENIF